MGLYLIPANAYESSVRQEQDRQSFNDTEVAILTNTKLRMDINYLNSSALSLQLSLSGGLTELQPHPAGDRVWPFQAWAVVTDAGCFASLGPGRVLTGRALTWERISQKSIHPSSSLFFFFLKHV